MNTTDQTKGDTTPDKDKKPEPKKPAPLTDLVLPGGKRVTIKPINPDAMQVVGDLRNGARLRIESEDVRIELTVVSVSHRKKIEDLVKQLREQRTENRAQFAAGRRDLAVDMRKREAAIEQRIRDAGGDEADIMDSQVED